MVFTSCKYGTYELQVLCLQLQFVLAPNPIWAKHIIRFP